MRHAITAIVAIGALALAAPASAQLVNGLPGPNYHDDTPIGTKGGGAPSTLQAPGERAAIAGALRNEMDARAMRPTYGPLVKTASVKKPALRQSVARNEFSGARERLENSSD